MPPSIAAFRQLGLNIVSLHDFHPDPQGARLADNQGEFDPGPRRFKEQQALFEGARRLSDRNFLVWPTEETDVYLGGHTEAFLPKPVYFSKVRQPGQPMVEQQAPYGEVYHLGSLTELTDMVKKFGGMIGLAHPETKGSAGYLDQILESPVFPTELFFGTAYQSLPVDLSEKRLCERRCFDVLDLMNNNSSNAKLLLAENDTYETSPEEDLYAYTNVNYIKLAQTPRFDDDWSPILRTLRRGDFFVTSGEVLFRNWRHRGDGGSPDLERRRGMDVPARVRGAGLGRRHEGRTPDHSRDRSAGVWHPSIQGSLRRDGEKVGALRRVGLGGQRGVSAACASALTTGAPLRKALLITRVLDVVERIGIEDDEVGALSRRDRAHVVQAGRLTEFFVGGQPPEPASTRWPGDLPTRPDRPTP